ncbi:helix-turn-helix domain-containing protein [Nocardioides sambongensis]|uniref:helix-turn-helix domain-containing protein n=1 Tax=Nocardioides sambongensis TaxID=2589074 RepID=UPI0011266096|nr:helix-turn-helix transcriptional regulator [Nocardioides sambongensis]
MSTSTAPAGALIRGWRHRRRLSQEELAHRAEVSTRHLSCIETGRSRPTSTMLLRLCDQLEVPLREQNQVLLAAGHAPVHPEHALAAPAMAEANAALETILAAHEPYPALVVDRHWDLVTANEAAYGLLAGVDADLLEPPVNVLRLSVHPRGLAPRIDNLTQWRTHLHERVAREARHSGDPVLARLAADLHDPGTPVAPDTAALVVPLRLRTPEGVLSFVSTTTVFGTPREVTLSELAIEAFYPADEPTRRALSRR